MQDLTQMRCEACRRGAPRISEEEMARFLPQVRGWRIRERDGVRVLERSFTFRNFAEALAFTRKVGELAEAQGHHPTLVTEWGRVHVTWFTRKIRGLHRNDFIMAARTERLYEGEG